MFTVKQETENHEMIWTDIEVVTASRSENVSGGGSIDTVFARPKAGEIRFDASPGKHLIYVMNAAGATVARYNLGNRCQVGGAKAEPVTA